MTKPSRLGFLILLLGGAALNMYRVVGFTSRCQRVSTRTLRVALGVSGLADTTNGISGLQNGLYECSTSAVQDSGASKTSLTFETTPLGSSGKDLMDGLDLYTVPSEEDGHPLSVYGIGSDSPVQAKDDASLRPILLLHGRTWSSVPVYHLFGGPKHAQQGQQSRSLMEAFLAAGLQPYAMDFRGFGGTHHDETGFVEPNRCVLDTESALHWISKRHGLDECPDAEKPVLFGWSQGALVAQLAAQKIYPSLDRLVLYGSIYDPLVRYPREPLYSLNKPNRTIIENTFDGAIEDFTVEGSIPPEPARTFAEAALTSDPTKAMWRSVYQFNNCDPGRVHVPTLVVAGDQDPYAPLHVQQELFLNLGRGSDRTWSILADSDHAAHLLEGRERLINTVVSFVRNRKRKEHGKDH
jgi:pimeloyl-ACP methyl ester carboxylesterase